MPRFHPRLLYPRLGPLCVFWSVLMRTCVLDSGTVEPENTIYSYLSGFPRHNALGCDQKLGLALMFS